MYQYQLYVRQNFRFLCRLWWIAAGSGQRAGTPVEGEAGWECVSTGPDFRIAIKWCTADPSGRGMPWWWGASTVNGFWCSVLLTTFSTSILYMKGRGLWSNNLNVCTLTFCVVLWWVSSAAVLSFSFMMQSFLLMLCSCVQLSKVLACSPKACRLR